MDKKSMRLLTWHLLPAAYLLVFCGGAVLFLPAEQLDSVDLDARIVGSVGWAAVSGGMLLHRLRRQRLAASSRPGSSERKAGMKKSPWSGRLKCSLVDVTHFVCLVL